MFLGDLRQVMGDQAFLDFLRAYLAQNRGHQATTQGFFELLSHSTSADQSGLNNSYFSKR
jgi:aminopeptidase N